MRKARRASLRQDLPPIQFAPNNPDRRTGKPHTHHRRNLRSQMTLEDRFCALSLPVHTKTYLASCRHTARESGADKRMDLQSQRRTCEGPLRSHETSDGIPQRKTVLCQSCSGSSQPGTENPPAKAWQSLDRHPRSISGHSSCRALWAIPTYHSSPERPRVASSILARLTLLLCESLRPLRLCVILFPLSSLSSHRRLRRFAALRLRHSFIRSRRLFQNHFPRLHLRARDVLRRLASPCPRLAFARHSPLVTRHFPRRRKSLIAPQRLPRQRLELLQARQLLQVAQSKPHQEFLRRLVQNRPPHHFLAPRRGNQVLVQQRADHPRSVHPANL